MPARAATLCVAGLAMMNGPLHVSARGPSACYFLRFGAFRFGNIGDSSAARDTTNPTPSVRRASRPSLQASDDQRPNHGSTPRRGMAAPSNIRDPRFTQNTRCRPPRIRELPFFNMRDVSAHRPSASPCYTCFSNARLKEICRGQQGTTW